jgi:hypothetical protein
VPLGAGNVSVGSMLSKKELEKPSEQ